MFKKCALVNFVSLFCVASGARILGIVPTPSYSHQVVFQPLWRELSLRGHQVTTITTDPINDPFLVNLTEIDLSFSYKSMGEGIFSMIKAKTNVMMGLHNVMDEQLQYHKVQELIKDENIKFDLVIIEYMLPTMVAFAEKFKCPHIGMLSLEALSFIYALVGNPTHPVLYPECTVPFSKAVSLSQRLFSVKYTIHMRLYVELYLPRLQQSLVEKHFGPNYPSINAMSKNLSLLFINSDPVFHPIRPLVPAVIQIGGGSLRTAPKPLPKDLQKLLDDASSGFIYFSLGSNIECQDLPEDIRNEILVAFSELPFTVIWKFEADDLPNKPSNVFISKWLPQRDILNHPKIKLFITQGGLQSMDEAIYAHVPMVGMPFYGDQTANVIRMEEKGFGLSLDFYTLEKQHFKETILEVINNPLYRNKIKELAELAADQPMTGLEKAIWWTEYVLRHKGAKHLRSPALDIPLYQYILLDVIGVLLVALTMLIFILYIIVKLIVKFITCYCSKLKSSKMKQQ